MTGAPLVYIDKSEVREGALQKLKAGFTELVGFVEENVPDALTYGVYLSDDGTEVTVLHVHRHSSSLEQHLEVGGPEFKKFTDLLRLKSIRVFGEPSEKAIGQLQGKARMLGCDDVAIQRPHAGFVRAGAPRTQS